MLVVYAFESVLVAKSPSTLRSQHSSKCRALVLRCCIEETMKRHLIVIGAPTDDEKKESQAMQKKLGDVRGKDRRIEETSHNGRSEWHSHDDSAGARRSHGHIQQRGRRSG